MKDCNNLYNNVFENIPENLLIKKKESKINDKTLLSDCKITTDNKELINFLEDYIREIKNNLEEGKNLFLTGKSGLGKSFILNAFKNTLKQKVIYREIEKYEDFTVEVEQNGKKIRRVGRKKTIKPEKDNVKVLMINLYDMIVDLRKKYNGKEPENNYYDTYDILILDEVGVQYGTEDEIRLIYDVVNFRYDNYLPTFCISNYNEKKVGELLRQRIFDRLINTKTTKINLTGKSWR